MNTSDRLIATARAVVNNPAFQSKDITGDGKAETFCNWGVRLIAESVFGFSEFNDLNANAIYQKLSTDKKWRRVPAETAASLAVTGNMVIAAQFNPAGSGHVAFVLPGEVLEAGKWSKAQGKVVKAPTVANVGPINGIKTANHYFGTEPEYFVKVG